jgi:hypothetical protein
MAMIERPDTPPQSRRRRFVCAVCCAALAFPPLVHAAQPAMPPELKAPEKPTAMPAFVLPTTAGSKLDSKSLQGRVLLIRFWASW